MAAKVAAPQPVGIDANLEELEVIKQVEQEEMAEKVEKNKSLIAKRNNSPKPLAPLKEAIRTAAGFMLVHQDRVDREDGVQEKKTKKKKLSERLEEPIEVKTGGRCRKAKERRQSSHKMKREPLVSSLCDVDLNLSRDGQ